MAQTAPFDAAALDALYQRLEKPMYNVVYRRLGNAEESMDVVQESFAKVWKARDRVLLETAEAYAWRTALNLASNRRRSQRLWSWFSFDDERDGGEDAGAESGVQSRQREAAVRAAVDSLPEKMRDVVLLCEFSAMTQAEVAAVLDIPPGTVASRRHLAAAKLRELLEGV